MEKVVCPHCGKVRRRKVFWEGASVVCKCGAVGEYLYGKWRWFKDQTPIALIAYQHRVREFEAAQQSAQTINWKAAAKYFYQQFRLWAKAYNQAADVYMIDESWSSGSPCCSVTRMIIRAADTEQHRAR